MQAPVRATDARDMGPLKALVAAMHAEGGLPTDARTEAALGALLAGGRSGFALVAPGADGALVGYVVVGVGYSLEFHGADAFVDELYVVPQARRKGLGSALLEAAEAECVSRGVHALHLEVDHDNGRAHELYRRLGFQDHPRHLMTKWLAPRPDRP